MLVFTVVCLATSSLLSFTSAVESMEASFYQQLLAYVPGLSLFQETTGLSPPYALQELILVFVFSLLAAYQVFTRRAAPSIFFVILVIFALFMLQMLLAILYLLWVPAVWSIFSFAITALLLLTVDKIQRLRKQRPLSIQQQRSAILRQIESKNFKTAVIMLKKAEFTDELFDIAYDLGVELERLENWELARYLYVWLVQFDPGLADFVTRMDYRLHPEHFTESPAKKADQKQKLIGQYQLVAKKAQGATATVYEAYDLKTQKRIALKILNKTARDSDAEYEALVFLREALTVSALDHPNIVKIYDADIYENHAYIAMDYIDGYALSDRLQQKNYLSVAESLQVMKSVLQALVVAHSSHIVHGDIKPANIMYDQHKKLYILTDFGAANKGRSLSEEERFIVGTPAYMSPEQLSGAKMDGRSDLFSLAVTIYHLLSGRQPFSAEKLSELKGNILNQQVDLADLDIPDMLGQILHKALQKKTYHRYADASQMLQAVSFCEHKLTREFASEAGDWQ